MRLLVLACLLAAPVSAQTVEAPPVIPVPDSTAAADSEPLPVLTTADLLGESGEPLAPRRRPYSSFSAAGGFGGVVGALGIATARVGVEMPSGVRLGAVGVATTLGSASSIAIGPEVSVARDLGLGVRLRASGQGTVGLSASSASARGSNYSASRLSAGGVLELEREVPLVGSVRLVPRLGVFSHASRLSAVPERGFDARTLRSAGVIFGTDVRFRAFGGDATLGLTLPLPLAGNGYIFDGLAQPIGGVTFGLEF